MSKTCTKCGTPNLSEDNFDKNNRGCSYSYCKSCRKEQRNLARRKRFTKPENKLKRSLQVKAVRQDPLKRANIIAIDSRASDKKYGRDYDLTLDLIRSLISKPCSYCGETELQMTLDRVNNEIGHTENNVLPACIRCNLIRKAMPYEAWLCLIAGLKEAKEKKLFGDWLGK